MDSMLVCSPAMHAALMRSAHGMAATMQLHMPLASAMLYYNVDVLSCVANYLQQHRNIVHCIHVCNGLCLREF